DMHERPDDLAELQAVLDRSYESAGPHLRGIATTDRRLDAGQLAERLTGMRLLVLATSTRDGRPINGPVDGIFYRGRFHFGSSPESLRYRHLRERPAVSATHLPGEFLAVTVHGDAEVIDVHAPEHAEFKQTVLDIYTPRYGDEWAAMLDGGAWYARINASRMFTFSMPDDDT
ncbi:MAG TPA: pyridoxamine 5'-phosphate oxidase family protein, partial [Ilumatobacteraceae bacterium]|nr:pyridoxamine 5'-phosphate oxidase family protein [Ilumatobacteraceae bacterium]